MVNIPPALHNFCSAKISDYFRFSALCNALDKVERINLKPNNLFYAAVRHNAIYIFAKLVSHVEKCKWITFTFDAVCWRPVFFCFRVIASRLIYPE